MSFQHVLVMGLAISLNAFAGGTVEHATGGLDAASVEAAQKTQNLLTNPAEREKVYAEEPNQKHADQTLKNAVGEENAEDTYKLAAEVFNDMVRQSGGDSMKMMELMQKAQKDPAGFANSWTPEQKAKLKAIGNRVPSGAPALPK